MNAIKKMESIKCILLVGWRTVITFQEEVVVGAKDAKIRSHLKIKIEK